MKNKEQTKKKTSGLSSKQEQPQDVDYWQNRSLSDSERDWGYGEENWIKDYVKSANHPHRDVVLGLLDSFEWSSLIELGCSSGPNLIRLREAYPERLLYGVDANADSIKEARNVLPPSVDVRVHDMHNKLPFDGFDVVLADASLMYINPTDIGSVMDEISRLGKKAVLIVDRFAESDEITGHVWGRNYTKLLEERGYSVKEVPVTEKDWSTSKNWQKYGKYFLGLR